ncbi:hypothetical protein [Kitasatospora sp. NPDC047058]|uniref:hypothetical protein n=1 Tax=Kitasatospora sp. NPDC047058 TaxID=3155620 RepID=UPI00340D0560
MAEEFTTEDVRQMRQEGDLMAFVRGRIRRHDEKSEFPAAAPPKSRPDGRPVGAWPEGAGRPGDPLPYKSADDVSQ